MPMDVAALIFRHRRDQAAVIVDCGGGYGGGVCERLADNAIRAIKFIGSSAGNGRTQPGREHGFANKRAEAWWRFREALDPDQPGGSPIALPEDAALRADLAAQQYEITPRNEVKIEEKAEVKKRIGRSPDRGDAIVMAWAEGQRAVKRGLVGAAPWGKKERQKFAKVDERYAKVRRLRQRGRQPG